MLSTIGKVFFEVTTISRAKGEFIPTVYLSIRNANTGKMMGQMRFNLDKNYSDKNVRMAFNMMDSNLIDPIRAEGCDLLEEIVIGGFIWASMDNHYLFSDELYDVLPYMVVHDYAEDNNKAGMINAKIKDILMRYCIQPKKNIFVFNPKTGNKVLSSFLKDKQQS